ncbi:MAG: LPS export ABC transporter ATP-binding protein [Candidatus Loosdrechtia sp.]|uniref:LPS export ABC transporter ATP-binding protein n=1 Tax=Candidatus Loosdrechtia sp. TaxID=3101272 RepID=UPI003A5F0AE6|nr:MAG: LPS export ABC transporter ATP-binding protein [Candidatus Jettenia sp. AMX2]
MNLLKAEGLTKSFGKRTVVNQVSFEVSDGEIVGLLGQNGAGKSTSFSMVIGTVRPDRGRVIFQNEDITNIPIYLRARKGMGYLCQEPSVFQRLTVEENILAILETHRYSSTEKYDRLTELLTEYNLKHLAKNKAFTLSGGERRRLEIARVLVNLPTMILLDEPFTGVDPIAVNEVQDILLRLKNKGIGLLITDHNVREALSITTRSYIISEGIVVASGTTQEILSNPVARQSYLGDNFPTSENRLTEFNTSSKNTKDTHPKPITRKDSMFK